MNTMAIHTPRDATMHLSANLESLARRSAEAICPEILLHLNVSVFRQLRTLQTPKSRICAVLNLSSAEYDYVDTLA